MQIDLGPNWYGNWLVRVQQAGAGSFTTWYAHMQRVLVRSGQAVGAGQQIGDVGALGNASGCHLHFEIHTRGGPIYGPDQIDPHPWLVQVLAAGRQQA